MKRRMRRGLVGVVAVFLMLPAVFAADWPTWRHDPARTGYSPEGLPEEIHLQWTRKLPPVAMAWPCEPRMQFDPCHEPVVMGKTLFVGSPNDGSVRAYETETGKQRWRFYTNGPIRFAPVAFRGRLYAASDDGRIYCLDAETGELNWTFRTAPKERPDLYHLGNNRLISFWPVRGGPVIVDGVLYVGSGIWPTMGTFVYALDPGTGNVVWVNDRLNYMTNIRIDHNRIADSALCPQGYLVARDGKLLVPNGRSMPVGLDAKTGKLLYYIQGYRNGACRVTAGEKYVFVGRKAVLDINTGRKMGERWHEFREETPKEYSPRYDLFESPFVPYKFIQGCDAWSVLAPGVVFGGHEGTFYACDSHNAKKTTYGKKVGGHELHPGRWDAPVLWTLQTPYAPEKWESSTIVRAGNRLYGHTGQVLMAVDIPAQGEEPRLAWEEKLPGTPASMLAADDKLFVVTQEGHILCFGGGQGNPGNHGLSSVPLREAEAPCVRQVERILKATSATEGYCLVLGLKDGQLVEELLRRSKLKVIGVDADKNGVDALRDRLVAAGLYANRVDMFVGDPFTFAFPPYIASLIVSEDYDGAEIAGSMRPDRLLRVLRPYGGTACFQKTQAGQSAFSTWLSATNLENAELLQSDGFCLLRRVGPLPGSAHWTHECADAARTYFSRDKLVKAPLGVLWYGDGPEQGFKKYKDYHIGVKPQVVNGRLFAFNERSNTLRAYDVYTGRALWEKEVDAFTRFASMPDGVYVAGGNACVVYDPGTGAELKRFTYSVGNGDDTPLFVADTRVGDDVIVVAVAFEKVRKIDEGLYDSTVLLGLDRRTGEQLWTRKAKDRFNHHGLALGRGVVFCVDSPSMKKTEEMKRRGNAPETLDSTVLALHPRTGRVVWEKVLANPLLSYTHTSYPTGSVQSLDDALFYSEECDVLIVYKDKRYRAVKGKTGDPIWDREKGASQPIIVAGDRYYEQGGAAFDVRTGRSIPSKARVPGGNGCNHAIANEHLFFRRRFTAAYFDIQTGEAYYMRSARSGCTNSLIPADGVLSSPCFSVGCVCNHPLETSFCLVHMPEAEGWDASEPVREPLPLGERDPDKWTRAEEDGR